MSEVIILTMGPEQLVDLIARKASEMANDVVAVEENIKLISKHKVDRHYLKRNFGWRRTTIERMENDGELVPVFTGDARSHYYLLGACLKLYLKQQGKL